jgi:hypothetical protein
MGPEYIIPLGTFVANLTVLLVGFIYNNSRISDLRSDMNQRFGDINQRLGEINQRFGDLRDLLNAKLARQEEMLLAKFAELDNRLTRIESHLNLH